MEQEWSMTDEERAARRAQRIRERQRKRGLRRRRQLRLLLCWCAVIAAVAAVSVAGARLLRSGGAAADGAASAPEQTSAPAASIPAAPAAPERPGATPDTVLLGEEIDSDYAIVVDPVSSTILAQKNADAVISPASMTKILTVLVASELVGDRLDDTFTVTIDITDFCYSHDCSAAGFCVGETVSVRDLFYGTILPSGADAAAALAVYAAGSQEAFVEKMNEKLAALGLADTAHFTNCVGIYDPGHTCTVADMAVILQAAVADPLCREVLSAHTYTTTATPQHPQGLVLSNWFLRRIEDKDSGALQVVCAKTGYVVQSGSCAASYAEGSGGRGLICVTGKAGSAWRCIYDHAALYSRFAPAG